MRALAVHNRIEPKLLIQQDVAALDQVTEDLLTNVSEVIIHGTGDQNLSFADEFRAAYPFLDNRLSLNDEKNRRIYYYGVWKTLIEMLKRSNEAKQQLKDYDAMINTSKYMTNLIEVLQNKNYCTHSELAKDLKLSTTNLTNLIHRIAGFQLLSIKKAGKCKLYRLTGRGDDLYSHLARSRQTINFDGNAQFKLIHELMTAIIQVLSQGNPQPLTITQVISKYAALNQPEMRQVLIQAETISNKAAWMKFAVNELSNYKKRELDENRQLVGSDAYIRRCEVTRKRNTDRSDKKEWFIEISDYTGKDVKIAGRMQFIYECKW